MADLRLTLAKNQRISTLAYAIWAAGITPWSWSWQCGPEWGQGVTDDDIYLAGMIAYQREQHDAALESEIARAQEILASQGKVLGNIGETA